MRVLHWLGRGGTEPGVLSKPPRNEGGAGAGAQQREPPARRRVCPRVGGGRSLPVETRLAQRLGAAHHLAQRHPDPEFRRHLPAVGGGLQRRGDGVTAPRNPRHNLLLTVVYHMLLLI